MNYYLKKNESEEGPLTSAQINRKKQKGEIAADTLCRQENETAFRRVDEIFPHLKDRAADPEKMARIKESIGDEEGKALTKIGIIAAVLSFFPLVGFLASCTAVTCGILLVVRHNRMIGIIPILIGGAGVVGRFLPMG